MAFFRLSPITAKRVARFKRLRRGYYSLLFLLLLCFLSLFAEMIANKRAIAVRHNGEWHFPTYGAVIPMAKFGQTDEFGFDDAETDYRRLKEETKGTDTLVIMPPIPFDPYENDFSYPTPSPHAPDDRHVLGTDPTGRSVAARLIYGFRVSISFAICLWIASHTIGVVIGALQGYIGGRFDLYSQRLVEIWSTIPFLYVAILTATIFTANFWLLLGILTVFSWIGMTYYMRAEMYREKTRDYAAAAKSMGASHLRIIFKHLLPNCVTPLVTLAPFAVVGGIFSLTSLDYLGYGLPPPTPSWGAMIDDALQSDNRGKLWLIMSPFVAITATLLLVTLIGESIREAFDPKQYARYE